MVMVSASSTGWPGFRRMLSPFRSRVEIGQGCCCRIVSERKILMAACQRGRLTANLKYWQMIGDDKPMIPGRLAALALRDSLSQAF